MSGHVPVMLDEVLEALSPRDGAHYIDGTFGGGGYTRAILEAADCRVLGIDRDPDAIARGQALVAHFGGRLTLVQGEFSRMDELADGLSDGVVLDLGVSSFQFDEAERGFSFRADGPLDMRMSKDGESAADFVNTTDEKTLIHVISRYGEEHRARTIARAIIAARPVTRTAELAAIVSDALGPQAQALRHPSRDAHLPGAAHPCERRARRTGARPRCRDARACRPMAVSRWCRSIRWKTASSSNISRARATPHRARRAMRRICAARLSPIASSPRGRACRALPRSTAIRARALPDCAPRNASVRRRRRPP